MKKYLKLFLILLIVGCSKKTDSIEGYFTKTKIVEPKVKKIEILKDSSVIIGSVWGIKIFFVDNMLILNDISPVFKMKIINLSTNRIRNFGQRGRGPNEFSSNVPVNNVSIEKSRRLYVDDDSKYFVYHIDSLKNNIDEPISTFSLDPISNKMAGLFSTYCNGDYIVGSSDKERFMLYNLKTKKSKTMLSYRKGTYLSNNTQFSKHPTKNKVAFAMTTNEAMGILTVKNDSIEMKELFWWQNNVEEVSETNGNAVTTYAKISFEIKETFVDLTTSNSFIYALYSGKNRYDINTREINDNRRFAKWIYVFDWQGNPIKRYKLDKEILSIAVDEKNETMYAASYKKGEPYFIKFKIE